MTKFLKPFFFCAVLLMVVGCAKKRPGHNGILSYNEMKLVLWDMAQADEYAAVYLRRDSTKNLQDQTNKVYQEIFDLHKTDSAQFFTSFAFYKTHPDHYKILLDSLSALANRERDHRFYLNTLKPATPARKVENKPEP